ncbi:MAG: large subunit ribosomal protein L19e [Candidatus Diapherotrites archaeon]|nr:large subunit ribosomal protein L19e [Candidatus Diapherotrites archaeon]MDN5366940.1 large subunit ribosomal protein L19e [Candidatus Diapherotrites archaeon]
MKVDRAKELVAEIFKVGVSRVRIRPDAIPEVEEAMTKDDLRGLVERGVIEILPKRSPSRHRARYIHRQKRKGRRRGMGSRKGRPGARLRPKLAWMLKIRAIRRFLRVLRSEGKITSKEYRRIYMLAKGGHVRSRRHVLEIIEEMRR